MPAHQNELLAATGNDEPAARLLAAADADPLAPAVLGPERHRHARLRADLAGRLGPATAAVKPNPDRAAVRLDAVALALEALERHRVGPRPASPGQVTNI